MGKSVSQLINRFSSGMNEIKSENAKTVSDVISAWNNSGKDIDIFDKLIVTNKDIANKLIPDSEMAKFDEKFDPQAALDEMRQTKEDIQKKLKDNKNAFTEWADDVSKTSKEWQVDFIKNNDLAEVSLDKVTEAQKTGANVAKAYNVNLKSLTIESKLAAVAMDALAMAGNMIIGWVIGQVISFTAKKIDELAHAAENCADRVNDLMASYKSAMDTECNIINHPKDHLHHSRPGGVLLNFQESGHRSRYPGRLKTVEFLQFQFCRRARKWAKKRPGT